MWNVEKNENIPTKSDKNCTKLGNPYYLVLFENCTKPGTVLGETVLSETVLSGDSLYKPLELLSWVLFDRRNITYLSTCKHTSEKIRTLSGQK